jgi:chitin disaccharide deacetylase
VNGCQLIVNADDFGLSEAVNIGIVDSHKNGIVTSTSLMACGAAFAHAVKLAKEVTTLDVGVHLTLTGERPVLPAARVPTLVDEEGRFIPHTTTFLQCYLLGRIRLSEVERELDAQVERVTAEGLSASHLDGHQHVHMLPGIRRVVGRIARRHGITAIRFPREAPKSYMLAETRRLGRLLQLLAVNASCAIAPVNDARRSDHFCGFFFGGRLNRRNLSRLLRELPLSGTVELMCHPGRADPQSVYSDWRYCWQDELDALTDTRTAELLRQGGVKLTSYAALAAR